jgi:hypothetical protein
VKKSDKKFIGQKLKEKAELRQQIIDRVTPAVKVNPNAPKRKTPYAEGTPGFNRAALGVTMTAIQASINEHGALVHVMLDENDQPTGETVTEMVPPTRATRYARRSAFVARGLLGPFAYPNERRKTHRRNKSYAAVNSKGTKPPKKQWHRSAAAKAAAPAPVKKKAK